MRREELPALGVAQMRDVEHWMVEEMGIATLQMLENTGMNFARLVIERFGREPAVVFAGRGNNGAGGLAAARHLANRGVDVTIVLAQPLAGMSPNGAHQLETDRGMGIPILSGADAAADAVIDRAGVLIDALMGYRLSGQPHGLGATLIEKMTASNRPIAALDVPSGIDPELGTGFEPHVWATATAMLGVPKKAALTAEGAERMGEIYLSDISIPPALYARLGYRGPPLFTDAPFLRLE